MTRRELLGGALAMLAPLGILTRARAAINVPTHPNWGEAGELWFPGGPLQNWSDVGYHGLGPAAIPTRAATIAIGPGRHEIRHKIVLRSGQILRGAGRDRTTLYFPEGLRGMGHPPVGSWDWKGGVIDVSGASEVGIEDMTIEFGPHKYTHHQGQGYNGIEVVWPSHDCWVRNVTIINADEALHFHGVRRCTGVGIRIIGGNHLQVAWSGESCSHNLVHDLEISGGSIHGLTGNWGAYHNVFSRVRSPDGRIRVEPNHNGPDTHDLLYSDIVDADPTAVPIGGSLPAVQLGRTLMWNVDRSVCRPPDLYVSQMRKFHGIDLGEPRPPSPDAPPPAPSGLSVTAVDGGGWGT